MSQDFLWRAPETHGESSGKWSVSIATEAAASRTPGGSSEPRVAVLGESGCAPQAWWEPDEHSAKTSNRMRCLETRQVCAALVHDMGVPLQETEETVDVRAVLLCETWLKKVV